MRAPSLKTIPNPSASVGWCACGSTRPASARCRASSTCSSRTACRRRAASARATTSAGFMQRIRSPPEEFRRSMFKRLFLAALLICGNAHGFPTKPVRMIVPFPPGGATDIIGRLLAAKMQEVWGQPVVVENRPGAGTVVGTDLVAKSAPDGHTLGVVVTAHVINPSLRPNMPYDTLKDLAAVSQVSVQHLVIAAHPSLEANSVAELIALAKKNPGTLS